MKKILLLIVLSAPFILQAQPGTLDKSFGDNGIVLDKSIIGGGLQKIALQSDGKIIGAGNGSLNNIPFLLIRYNVDGSIDTGFGNNGVVENKNLTQPLNLAIQNDDAIIVQENASFVRIVKYRKDGIIDSLFGNNGIVVTVIGQGQDAASAIAIQPDGKIAVCGYIINEPNEARQGFLVRYLPDGSLDAGFGDKGIAIWGEPNGDKSLSTVNALALQQNGQIIVAYANIASIYARAYRFNSDGSMDKDFGNNGEARFQPSDDAVSSLEVFALTIQPDGKIVGGGNAGARKTTNSTYMAAARLNTDGSIDSSFGNNGIQHVMFGKDDSQATSILLQKDSKIILSGWANAPDYAYGYFALTRLKPDGSFDESFGDKGQTTTETEGFAVAESAVLQQDEKIVLGGSTVIGVIGGSSYFLLARYNNDEATKKQIIITKIKKWLQHRNGFTWDNNKNASSYVVQRSYDGIHFSSVARINANNSSNYTYADPSPLSGNNYYRLQTTSVNGAINYSNILAVTADENAITISPNPAKNNLHIEGLPAGRQGLSSNTKLTIVDFSGNIKLKAVANNASYNLNIAVLKPGNYLLKIEMNNEVITKKFVKE